MKKKRQPRKGMWPAILLVFAALYLGGWAVERAFKSEPTGVKTTAMIVYLAVFLSFAWFLRRWLTEEVEDPPQ